MIKAIFVNNTSATGKTFAYEIVHSNKPLETRKRNMLKHCIGCNVSIIETSGKIPVIVGTCDIVKAEYKTAAWLNENRHLTLIAKGSKFDVTDGGKWCYYIENAAPCDPYPLPASAIRHGRSWCEF